MWPQKRSNLHIVRSNYKSSNTIVGSKTICLNVFILNKNDEIFFTTADLKFIIRLMGRP